MAGSATKSKNISRTDCVVRFAIGIVFIALGVAATPWINFLQLASAAWYLQSILSILVGVFFIRSALRGTCPVNRTLGVSTRKRH